MKQLDRAIGILKSPNDELTKVKSEGISKEDLIRQYIAVLAVIPAIAYIIGMGFVGITMGMFGSFKFPIEWAVAGGILTYVLSIAGVYVTGIVINALAPNFASKQNETQAMKLAAYSATPGLLGGIFNSLPIVGIVAVLFALYNAWPLLASIIGFIMLGISVLLTLYGLYIIYLGIPVLMETPKDKTVTILSWS